jgi:hypothetical protein
MVRKELQKGLRFELSGVSGKRVSWIAIKLFERVG